MTTQTTFDGVLSVTGLSDDTVYSTFTISGTETAFIAGYGDLTWSDFSAGFAGYYYQSEDIIDAEKCTSITQDDMMCWAGTAANMLYYTGWDLLDTTSEDDVFTVFIDHFTLGELYGGNPYYGIKWFFTGDYTPVKWPEWDIPIENSGGFYSDFFETKAISNYLTNRTFSVSSLTTAREKLEDGYSIGILFGYYNSSGERTGGHLITMWGMTCDTSLSVNDPNYYTGIIVTDSDDSKGVSDPLSAKDTLKIIEISYDSSEGKYVLDPDYAGENCILENLIFLAPNTSANPNSKEPVKIYSGNILVKEGKTFTGEKILADGNNKMLVSSGGTVNNTFNSRAMIELFGGVANSTTVTGAGTIYIYSGGTATSTTVDDKSSIGIHADGTANITTVNSGGEMYVFSRGTANSTTINSSGRGNVLGGGVANNVNVYNGGVLELRSYENKDNYEPDYASANNVTVFSGGSANISGGVVSRLLVSSGGIATVNGVSDTMYVDVFGEMYNTEVKSGGDFTIGTKTQLWGATVFGGTITVNDNADVYGEVTFDLSERETADGFIVNNLAYLNMSAGSFYTISVTADQAEGTYKLAQGVSGFTGTLTIGDGTNNYGSITVNGADFVYDGKSYSLDLANGDLTLTIGTTATPPISGDQVQVYSSGTLVKQGKVLTGETIIAGTNNSMFVYGGGTANETVVNSKGYMYVSGGVANNTTVNSYGGMSIFSGGIASSTIVSSGGYMYVSSGALANSTTLHGGVTSGGYWALMKIFEGGVANYTTLKNYGCDVYVYGEANYTTVSSMGYFNIESTGTANNTYVNPLGLMWVEGKANHTVMSGGYIGVLSAGIANDTTMENYASMNVWGVAHNTVLNSDGLMHVLSGGSAFDTTANSQGYIVVSGGGYAENADVNSGGKIRIFGVEHAPTADDYPEPLHGSAKNVTVYSGGSAYVSGGEITNLLVSSGGKVEYAGVADVTAVDVPGILYNGNIKSGASMIIGNNVELNGVIFGGTVTVTGWANVYGELVFDLSERTVNDSYIVDNIQNLTFTDISSCAITVTADQAEGTYKLAQGADSFTGTLTIGNGSVNYGSITVNGADFVYNGVTYSLDQLDGNLTLTISGGAVPSTTVADDLDGNGLADVVLVHTKQGYSGAWLTTGDKSVIKWGDLSYLSSDIEMLGTGRLYGTDNDGQDIFFADGKSVGAWNVVDGKVTGYKSIMSVNATTNVIGLGDFNGDGATDLLLRSTSGDLGYFGTDGTGWHYLKGLGKEWSVAAVGDLNGDGLDDTVLRHDAGFAGTFLTQANNTVKWANLDTLADDMTIVGTGDFNGDGVDDVLLQKADGWVGAWLVEDGSVDGFMGICKNTNSIEQIADFNGDGIDDLRIRTATGDIGVLYVNGADSTTWQYFQSVGSEWETKFSALA